MTGREHALRVEGLDDYVRATFGEDARVARVSPLGVEGAADVKQLGYGTPLLVEVTRRDGVELLVLHTQREGGYGHEHMADRAQALLWSYAAYNHLPRHVKAVDVGVFMDDGTMRSLAGASEAFLLTRYGAGAGYHDDLERLRDGAALTARDEHRCDALCDALVEVHQASRDEPALYRRHVRDLIGHGEGIFGIVDGWPDVGHVAARLEAIERACVWWRWRLRAYEHRLRRVHGDFHPWNILFDEERLTLLDRSRGEWGEPANDLTCLASNYLFFALQGRGRLVGPLAVLWTRLWRRYLDQTGDRELLQVAAPFLAFRFLVMASPAWYPRIAPPVQDTLLHLAAGVLAMDRLDPDHVGELCEKGDA